MSTTFSLPSSIARGLPADGPTRSIGWSPSAADRAARAAFGLTSVIPPAALGLAAFPRRTSEGQRLDPVFQVGDKFVPLFGDKPLSDEVIDYSRERTVIAAYHSAGREIPLPVVEDISIPVTPDVGATGAGSGTATGAVIGARYYRPTADAAPDLPLLVYVHGGGFAVGNLDSHDAVCRYIARRGGLAVLSIDYRLAPEHRYPAPLDDTVAALIWAREHAAELGVDATRIAVGG
ncbi:alpha/beta hydrolase, partial [Dietzia sp.]|uniref:alpha/beta hydrolase n=1 Tax=Dietzia sp. TaxID=1871616 RepID=UPI002FDAC3DF